MGFPIPRIQYKNVDTEGDVASGSGVINDIEDTSEIEVGMFVRAAGVPSGALVGTVGANSVTLASGVLATASNGDTPIKFGFEVLFQYPPIEETGENLEPKSTVTEALSGIRQVAEHYLEGVRKLKFSFLSQSIYTLLDTFLRTHGTKGKAFRYYADQTLDAYVDYELDALKVVPKKIAPKGVEVYVWEVPLSFRRIL